MRNNSFPVEYCVLVKLLNRTQMREKQPEVQGGVRELPQRRGARQVLEGRGHVLRRRDPGEAERGQEGRRFARLFIRISMKVYKRFD